jgi:hypothetical protein
MSVARNPRIPRAMCHISFAEAGTMGTASFELVKEV